YQTKNLDAQVIDLQRYDAILGKSWLYYANPQINWRTNTLVFKYGNKEMEVKADTKRNDTIECRSIYISRQQLAKIPNDNDLYAVYLGNMNKVDEPVLTPQAQKIVKEFSDVFPKSLPDELPPKRKVDHAIDLVPGAEPPSRPIYRLTYQEMNELKNQLTELLKKGFIQPSVSPYADALSRKPYLSVISVISTTLIENDKLAKSYQEDKHFAPIWDILHNPNATVKQKAQVKNYELVGNKIYLHEGKRLVVPRQKDIITKILQEAHDNPTSASAVLKSQYALVLVDKNFFSLVRYALSTYWEGRVPANPTSENEIVEYARLMAEVMLNWCQITIFQIQWME
ncbi:1899_t:CDS:2, partial [Entrophospora sp. SA101]